MGIQVSELHILTLRRTVMLLFIPFLLINHSSKKYRNFPMKGQECFPGSRMESGGEKTHLGTKGYAETEQN